jgi:mannose-6-phosphate isomerase
MASSDNVIRAGLTSKHVDVAELMRVADFAPSLPGAIAPKHSGEGAISFVPPVDDFRVSVLTTRGGQVVGGPAEGPRILVAVEGVIEVHAGGTQAVEAGGAVFIPHGDGPLSVSGSGTAVVAHT